MKWRIEEFNMNKNIMQRLIQVFSPIFLFYIAGNGAIPGLQRMVCAGF